MPRIILVLAMITATLAAPISFARIVSVPVAPTPAAPSTIEALPPLPTTTNNQFPTQFMPDLLPVERTLICNDFLKAIQDGDKAAAKKFVAPFSQPKFETDFAKLHQQLKNLPPLEQRFADQTPREKAGPNDNIWTFGYSIPYKDRWKNAKITMFYLKGEPAEIDGWDITIDEKPLSNDRMLQDAKAVLVFQFIGLNLVIALCGGIVLVLFLGLRSRRRTV